MKRTLQRHLSIMLGSVVLLVGLLAAAASFTLAYSEAKEFQDDLLKQIAAFSSENQPGNQTAIAQQPSTRTPVISDPESRIIIIHLPRESRPDWLPDALSSGFHTLLAHSEQLRVFILDTSRTGRIIIAQPTEVRDEVAIDSALRTLIPLLLLTPVLIWLVIYIVRNELSPITLLSKSLDEQTVGRHQAIADNGLPDEITPFIHAINRLLERVNNLMDQQRRFIADAAHELRSPLTALLLQSQNLKQASSLEIMRERVIPLQEGIERARKLTDQLLSLARTQAGTPIESEVNVSVMARELVAEYLPYAEANGIDLGLEESASLTLHTLPDALRLIMKNALDNALKYTPRGGEVTLRILPDKCDAVIEVVDNGPGIPAAERERVFDTFYRISGTLKGGSGLGLAIALEAATRLRGHISLHQRPQGSGLIFRYRHGKIS